MHRPGGLVFSNATLVAAVWALHKQAGQVSALTVIICWLAYIAGIGGRLFVPTHPLAIKFLGTLGGKARNEDGGRKCGPSGKPGKENSPANAGSPNRGDAKISEEKKGNSRKRVASPEPPRGKLVEAEGST